MRYMIPIIAKKMETAFQVVGKDGKPFQGENGDYICIHNPPWVDPDTNKIHEWGVPAEQFEATAIKVDEQNVELETEEESPGETPREANDSEEPGEPTPDPPGFDAPIT